MKARKTNPFIKAINEQIESYKREAKLLHEKAVKLAKDRMLIRALYMPMFANLTDDDQLYISVYDDRIYFNLYMRGLDSFKDNRLTSILSHAIDTITSDIKEKDYAEYDHKEYRLYSDDVYLDIMAYVKQDSPTCKKIMTGMEIKEVPKYKFICE